MNCKDCLRPIVRKLEKWNYAYFKHGHVNSNCPGSIFSSIVLSSGYFRGEGDFSAKLSVILSSRLFLLFYKVILSISMRNRIIFVLPGRIIFEDQKENNYFLFVSNWWDISLYLPYYFCYFNDNIWFFGRCSFMMHYSHRPEAKADK